LEDAGATVFPIPHSYPGQLSLPALLQVLHKEGITSLMVEGGQRVISSFLSAKPSLVDVLIVTVAPMLVGHAGIEALSCDSAIPRLDHICSQNYGRDTVMICKLST